MQKRSLHAIGLAALAMNSVGLAADAPIAKPPYDYQPVQSAGAVTNTPGASSDQVSDAKRVKEVATKNS